MSLPSPIPPPLPKQVRRRTRLRGLLEVLVGMAGLALLCVLGVVLLHAWPNYQAKKGWEQAIESLRVDGEPTTGREVLALRPPVEPGANFCDHPLIAAHANFEVDADSETVFLDPESAQRFEALGFSSNAKQILPSRMRGEMADLHRAREFLSGEDGLDSLPDAGLEDAEWILQALGARSADHADLAEAARRSSHARWPLKATGDEDVIEWSVMRVPQYNYYTAFSRAAVLRACAAMEVGEVELARQCLEVGYRLTDGLEGDPTVIALLVRVTNLQILLGGVWQGIQNEAWGEKELVWLQSVLPNQNLLRNAQFAYRTELAGYGFGMNEFIVKSSRKELLNTISELGNDTELEKYGAAVAAVLIPKGWFQENAVSCVRIFQSHLLRPVKARVYRTDHLPDPMTSLDQSNPLKSVLAQIAIPVHTGILDTVGAVETQYLLASLSCELELDRLRGQANDPGAIKNLPTDPLSSLEDRNPVQYRLLESGYLFWGVGRNYIDDGGVVIMKDDEPHKVDKDHSDEVWRIERQR